MTCVTFQSVRCDRNRTLSIRLPTFYIFARLNFCDSGQRSENDAYDLAFQFPDGAIGESQFDQLIVLYSGVSPSRARTRGPAFRAIAKTYDSGGGGAHTRYTRIRIRRAAGTQSIPVASPDRHFISRRSLSPPHTPAAHTQSRGSFAQDHPFCPLFSILNSLSTFLFVFRHSNKYTTFNSKRNIFLRYFYERVARGDNATINF